MRYLLSATAAIACMTGVAYAQYTGPSATNEAAKGTYRAAILADIVSKPNDGDNVTVEGILVRKVDDETYVLFDGTTEINVEIDDDDFPSGEVSAETKVRIQGEVDTHLTRDADIEADRVEILP